MQSENSPIKKIVVITVVILLIAMAFYFFMFKKVVPLTAFDEFGNPVAAQSVGQDLVDLLNQLQAVKLDNSLFQSDEFINLTDFSIALPNESQGRPNPFRSIR